MLVGMVVLSSLSVFSQKNLLTIEVNKKGMFMPEDYNLFKLKSAIYDSVIYTIPHFLGTDDAIYAFDLKTNIQTKLEIEPLNIKSKTSQMIFSISVFNNKFLLVTSEKLIALEKQGNKKIKIIEELDNKYNFTCSHFLSKDSVFLYVNYNFHPLEAKHQHVWGMFNWKNLSIENVTVKTNENIAFSHFVNKWCDVYNEKIVYAHTLDYNVYFFDTNFKPIDSIISNELDSNKLFMSNFSIRELNSKENISKWRDYENEHLIRIRKVSFLNDTTIYVILKNKKDEIIVDYWQKNNNSWGKIYTDSSAIWYVENQPYSKNEITYDFFYQNIYDLVYLGNNQFASVYYPFMEKEETSNFNKNDLFKKQNDLFKNKDTYFGLQEIKINLPIHFFRE